MDKLALVFAALLAGPTLMATAAQAGGLPSAAEGTVETEEGEAGTLNPQELSLSHVMDNVREGKADMMTCSAGYLVTKSGRHAMARELFELCAEQGWTGAMTWMSQLEDNGLGGPMDSAGAAEWNRRAAEAGDPVGAFNHGVDLIRGWGTTRDVAEGQRLVDRAAEAGISAAQRLRGAGYDLDEITPDADNWKYRPVF
ncbi:sel1 repeat family protein [Frigidibacter sp. MR17.14]|uniref:tetratricopeptide repeat protein n=1 Tax=Frigidibacter sp. MR17.14 TaxID=3126509 RepID=UPI003012D7A9